MLELVHQRRIISELRRAVGEGRTEKLLYEISRKIDDDHGALYKYCYNLDEKVNIIHQNMTTTNTIDITTSIPKSIRFFYLYGLPALTCITFLMTVQLYSRPSLSCYVQRAETWLEDASKGLAHQ